MAEFHDVVVPVPARAAGNGETFTLGPSATIVADAVEAGEYLAATLRTSTGFALPVGSGATAAGPAAGTGAGAITLSLGGAPDPGDESYALTVTGAGVTVRANAAAGLFAGVHTLLQLLPAEAL